MTFRDQLIDARLADRHDRESAATKKPLANTSANSPASRHARPERA